MGRKKACLPCRAALGATVLVLLLWPDSVSRAGPTILLHFEHSGREAGITLKDTIRLRVAGFTWSDGTIDLLWDSAAYASPPHAYVADGSGGAAAFDVSTAQHVFRFSDAVGTVATDRVGTSEMAIPQVTERWLRTSSESSPASIMHLIETTFEPAVWNPEIRR